MVQSDLAPVSAGQDACNAGNVPDEVGHAIQIVGPCDMNVRDLVVADGERTAAERVEHFTKGARSHAQKPRLAEHAIQQDRPAHVDMAVFADDPYARPDVAGGIENHAHRPHPARATSRAMSQPAGPNRWGS